MSAAAGTDAQGGRRARHRRSNLDRSALRALALAIGSATLLALLTIGTFGYLPRYQPDGRSVLDNADFRDGFRGWQQGGLVTLEEAELGHAILQNRNPNREAYLRRTIPLPAGRTSLRLSADIATSRVEHGGEPWQAARVYLVPQASDGRKLWDRAENLANLVGTSPRQHFEAVFSVAGAPEVTLGIELPYIGGRMDVANLALAIVDERMSFRLAAALLVCGWSLLAFQIANGVYHSIRAPMVRHWLVGLLAVLVAGLFMPPLIRQQLIERLALGFGLRLADPDAFSQVLVFGLLALLVRIGRPRDPFLLHLASWLLFGAVLELLQLFTLGRSPEAGQWLVGAIGTLFGLAVAELGLWVRRRLEPSRRGAHAPPLTSDPQE
jgi:hypothetical protein